MALALALIALVALAYDFKTSRIQADVLSWSGARMTFRVAHGRNPELPFPGAGPYDRRLGYSRLPSFIELLDGDEFTIARQARLSEPLESFVQLGGFPPYLEKSQAGLTIRDRHGADLFRSRFPARVYDDFTAIPELVVQSLLFIENRELLDGSTPTRNPAVEWDRLAAAIAGRLQSLGHGGGNAGGGSTLATQIEKFRHSPDGRTANAFEKLRQMASASLRAYRDGPDTTRTRQQIVVDYLNTTPLSGRRGFGEINGLGDGLWAWYGSDFESTNALLRDGNDQSASLAQRALAYKQVLSLLLAQRRPSFYLMVQRSALASLTDSHLRILAKQDLISAALAQAALAQELAFRSDLPEAKPVSFVADKATNSLRAELMTRLDLRSPYELDRLDLDVESTLDGQLQAEVTAVLQSFSEPAARQTFGLEGRRLLGRGDPAKVIFSVTLYERGQKANHLRLQADTLDQPFDLNQGAKLDLGSTAKFRTLITYLEIIAREHGRMRALERHELDAKARDAGDPLTRWTARWLTGSDDRSLARLLDAAMERRYSASPYESFFTGGGVHRFVNFRSADNGTVPTIGQAFRHSINLPFVRLMRDIVHYHMTLGQGPGAAMLEDRNHPSRQIYLELFADRDGSARLKRYFKTYGGHGPNETLKLLMLQIRRTKERLAVTFRSVRPEASLEAFTAFMSEYYPGGELSPKRLAKLYGDYAPERHSLTDRAFLADLHPLELWLVTYLQDHPDADRNDVLSASAIERQAAHGWLFRTKHKNAQNLRIRTILEREAFVRIHRAWQRLGYPFDRLVPSYATALGSSADRPNALAELIGIIVNNGLHLPAVQLSRLRFAQGTPYETEVRAAENRDKRVMAPEVAATLRRALIDVVEDGTARRAKGVFLDPHGEPLAVGGKTGTGDNRFKRFGKGGRLVTSTAVNRTATFVFFLGDRFFGSITAFVDGAEADRYAFTSSLPVQILKALAPSLQPLIDQDRTKTAEAVPGNEPVAK